MTDDELTKEAERVVTEMDCDSCQSSIAMRSAMTTIVLRALHTVAKKAKSGACGIKGHVTQEQFSTYAKQARAAGYEEAKRQAAEIVEQPHPQGFPYVDQLAGFIRAMKPTGKGK